MCSCTWYVVSFEVCVVSIHETSKVLMHFHRIDIVG